MYQLEVLLEELEELLHLEHQVSQDRHHLDQFHLFQVMVRENQDNSWTICEKSRLKPTCPTGVEKAGPHPILPKRCEKARPSAQLAKKSMEA